MNSGSVLVVSMILASASAQAAEDLSYSGTRDLNLQAYARAGELNPLPPGLATLYSSPWRSNVRTASAYAVLQTVGVSYEDAFAAWTFEEHAHVMGQLAEAGIRRVRIPVRHALRLADRDCAPTVEERGALARQLRAARAAGLRPSIVFVHVPPFGRPGSADLQEWWKKAGGTDLLPVDEPGTPAFTNYVKRTCEALSPVLESAREAGFSGRESYDLEIGHGLWLGAPGAHAPFPSAGVVDDVKPGGAVYEFGVALARKIRTDGYIEPALWWGLTHNQYELCSDTDVPPEYLGRAMSFSGALCGHTTESWFENTPFDRIPGVADVWPVRRPLAFRELHPPSMVIARPEGWPADQTRRDNLIGLILAGGTPVFIASLGMNPSFIPNASDSGMTPGEIRQKSATRALAFWCNQGAFSVILDSGVMRLTGQAGGFLSGVEKPARFQAGQSALLTGIAGFCDALRDARPLKLLTALRFRYAVEPDYVLIPASGGHRPFLASDMLVAHAYQLDDNDFAVAVYVASPNVARKMSPCLMTLEINAGLARSGTQLFRPLTGEAFHPRILIREKDRTVLRMPVFDDVAWLRLRVR